MSEANRKTDFRSEFKRLAGLREHDSGEVEKILADLDDASLRVLRRVASPPSDSLHTNTLNLDADTSPKIRRLSKLGLVSLGEPKHHNVGGKTGANARAGRKMRLVDVTPTSLGTLVYSAAVAAGVLPKK